MKIRTRCIWVLMRGKSGHFVLKTGAKVGKVAPMCPKKPPTLPNALPSPPSQNTLTIFQHIGHLILT